MLSSPGRGRIHREGGPAGSRSRWPYVRHSCREHRDEFTGWWAVASGHVPRSSATAQVGNQSTTVHVTKAVPPNCLQACLKVCLCIWSVKREARRTTQLLSAMVSSVQDAHAADVPLWAWRGSASLRSGLGPKAGSDIIVVAASHVNILTCPAAKRFWRRAAHVSISSAICNPTCTATGCGCRATSLPHYACVNDRVSLDTLTHMHHPRR